MPYCRVHNTLYEQLNCPACCAEDLARSAAQHPVLSFGNQVVAENTCGAKAEATIEDREGRYGDFAECARLSDTFLGIANGDTPVGRFNTSWERMKPFQREALRNIFLKVSRILNGDPDYADNWHDIQGYAKLVEERLK